MTVLLVIMALSALTCISVGLYSLWRHGLFAPGRPEWVCLTRDFSFLIAVICFFILVGVLL